MRGDLGDLMTEREGERRVWYIMRKELADRSGRPGSTPGGWSSIIGPDPRATHHVVWCGGYRGASGARGRAERSETRGAKAELENEGSWSASAGLGAGSTWEAERGRDRRSGMPDSSRVAVPLTSATLGEFLGPGAGRLLESGLSVRSIAARSPGEMLGGEDVCRRARSPRLLSGIHCRRAVWTGSSRGGGVAKSFRAI